MKKIITYLFLALVASVVIVGCEKKPEAPKAPEVPKEAPKAP